MRFVWIAPILPPLPIKNWGSNFAIVNDVSNPLTFGLLSVFANLID